MRIWKSETDLETMNRFSENNMVGYLGIEFIEIGDDYLKALMPVDYRTHQPLGLLHGGASVVLAETIGSSAGSMCVDYKEAYVVGLEINANHIKSAREGFVTGTARPLHIGKSTQVWEIKIESEAGELVCISRLTLAVVRKK